MRKRLAALLVLALATTFALIGLPTMPVAIADKLPNGITVQCTPSNKNIACTVSGCPRVGDYVPDALHATLSAQGLQSGQDEYNYSCRPDGTGTAIGIVTYNATPNLPLGVSVQVCRKVPLGSDKCGPVSTYNYTPAASAPANNPPAPLPNGQKPVRCTGGPDAGQDLPPGSSCCPAGSMAASVPAGQQCQAAPAPTNAVTFTFQKNGFQINAIIVNQSTVAGQCHYHAVNTNGIIPDRTDDFPIGANATVTRTYPAPPPLAKFHATVTCTGDFNGKSDEFGNTSADVTG